MFVCVHRKVNGQDQIVPDAVYVGHATKTRVSPCLRSNIGSGRVVTLFITLICIDAGAGRGMCEGGTCNSVVTYEGKERTGRLRKR